MQTNPCLIELEGVDLAAGLKDILPPDLVRATNKAVLVYLRSIKASRYLLPVLVVVLVFES
jgi:hypothetical protein